MFDYKNSRSNIINILKSKTPIEHKNKIPSDKEFTFENGIKTWVGSIFIDIKDSSKLFEQKDEKLARLMRAFTSEIICLFQDLSFYHEIGIRGDCVYAIYDVSTKSDLFDIFNVAIRLNTFMLMFNKIITNFGYASISAGIGLGCDENLIIKAGRNGTGINNKIWIGKAVVDASNLSSKANRNGISPIAMSSLFYSNINELISKKISNNNILIKKYQSAIDSNLFYHCEVFENGFYNWINGGMK